ncbi:class I SAM-dependent methyltransferase [Halosimplex halophilum]|uniref:class I SAM-dependent methyltransferase n=1 Tax=Halosimplex halophilum TaxID=2559572 RepID=UPI00107F26AF|nr:class I SAM-dependent methyltransferase [Halosimplex halophilum]
MAQDPETVFAANRRYWDHSTPRKMAHGSYPLAAFRAGESTLFDHEREDVGAVSGRSLLHLQCNNGLETLSWAREGAEPVGIDISGESLRVARELAAESGLDAAFVQCNVYDAADALDRRFDVVYTSRGVLGWLPDLDGWADAVARSLAGDGVFYLFEGHPLVHSFDGDLGVGRSYFETGPRERTESDFGADERHYLTHHRLGDVVTALTSAGLRVEFLREHPFDYWRRWERMVRDDAGRWRLPGDPIPLTFSLRARPA